MLSSDLMPTTFLVPTTHVAYSERHRLKRFTTKNVLKELIFEVHLHRVQGLPDAWLVGLRELYKGHIYFGLPVAYLAQDGESGAVASRYIWQPPNQLATTFAEQSAALAALEVWALGPG